MEWLYNLVSSAWLLADNATRGPCH